MGKKRYRLLDKARKMYYDLQRHILPKDIMEMIFNHFIVVYTDGNESMKVLTPKIYLQKCGIYYLNHGYEKIYCDGKLSLMCHWVFGKRDGLEIWYWSNGNKWRTSQWKNDKETNFVKHYSRSGKFIYETNGEPEYTNS